ncbi:uncharacterized protein LOC120002072 isoform X2 [Tripterygium wilfordii]|uniref:uncharacterized protein LOC120002072 isoform X2 n=1 Tax=Tripterygium wilfordii TaxID=458696 RepID=UPI0018F82868|nr:uncharacterized protein LOC120002072 isoform X2 [Tripterygium wilfordii]
MIHAYSIGSIEVAELDWGNEDRIRAVGPPFDYIIGTDVVKVYAEHLLERLLRTIFALSGPRISLLVGYEIRSTSVHEQMLQMWKRHFDLKIVPSAKSLIACGRMLSTNIQVSNFI